METAPATSRAAGLTTAEAQQRLRTDGPNELPHAPSRSPLWAFLSQFRSPLIALLVGAAIIAGALGEWPEALAIVAIIVINAVVGFLQEQRAERSVLALRSLTAPRANVQRDGHAQVIPANHVVRGDVLLLEGGDVVAADAELHEVQRLTVVESTLTGESLPVEKSTAPAPASAPLADQHHRVFMGTAVASGTGRAVVTAIGAQTELGHIARLLEGAKKEATPLQVQLGRVGKHLLWLCLGAVSVVAVVGLLRGEPWLTLLLTSLSLAVAAVPEGLPAIVTIALALGVQRMARRNVLVRRLPAVETLGSATVIATDKTGTLTTGVMVVREVWGAAPAVVAAAAACCNAELHADGTAVGDPTEVALLRHAKTLGFDRAVIERDAPRVQENPFDAVRKRMSVLRRDGVLYVKGAYELLAPLLKNAPAGAEVENAAMSTRGLRVLAIATGTSAVESELTLLGLVGLADPPRPEAIEAVRLARKAGIRTVMVTGDQRGTAEAIARELGILAPGESAEGVVHARVTPEDKLRIVRALKAEGQVVAMTGDGTNDAPALKEAHIGIAMGKGGVEVTREAADMVLADDNFASIVAAVREGRAIFDNIRKSLVYLLSGNTAELLVVLGASALGLPLPLLPLHLLWINLVTDGLPALALVMDPASDEALSKPPRPKDEPVLRPRDWRRVAAMGLFMGALFLALFATEVPSGTAHARAVLFNVLVFSRVLNVFAVRSVDRVNFEVGTFSNPRLLLIVAGTCALQVALTLVPPAARLLQLDTIDLRHTLMALGAGLIPVTLLELWKLARRLVRRLEHLPPAQP